MPLHEKLHQLFLLDKQVRGLSARQEAANAQLHRQQTKLDQITQQQNELSGQLKHTKAKALELEHEADDLERKVEQLRLQMNTVKNNKEYSAVLIELNTFKANKSKLDEAALEQLSKVELLEEEIKELDRRVVEQNKLLRLAQVEVHASQAEVGEQLDALKAQRAQAEEELPQEARDMFRKAARLNDGDAMAGVVEENRRTMEYSCGGCYMAIPVEKVSTLISRKEIVVCNNCGRILYLDQQLKTSIVSR